MSKSKLFSDYLCSYCFLTEFPLEEAIPEKDVEVEWLPFELPLAPQPTLKPEDDYLSNCLAVSGLSASQKNGD